MYEVCVRYVNGMIETIYNVESYQPICDGRLIKINTTELDGALLIPTEQIIQIGEDSVNHSMYEPRG